MTWWAAYRDEYRRVHTDARTDRLAGRVALRQRLDALARRLQAAPGTERAADLVEGLLSRAS